MNLNELDDCPLTMIAAAALASISGIVNIGDATPGRRPDGGGWLDVYTYEPLRKLVEVVDHVVDAISEFPMYERWEWRLFGRDGSLDCWMDGSEMDEDGVQIDGTNALKAHLQANSE